MPVAFPIETIGVQRARRAFAACLACLYRWHQGRGERCGLRPAADPGDEALGVAGPAAIASSLL